MKIFWSFLIIFTAVLLWIIPFTDAAHGFKTDVRIEEFTVTTGASTNATVQLFKDLYLDDTSSIDLDSHSLNDAPLLSSYNITTRAAVITGLAGNLTRQIDVSYDIDALHDNPGVAILIGLVPMLWVLIAVVFPLAGLFALWFMKR